VQLVQIVSRRLLDRDEGVRQAAHDAFKKLVDDGHAQAFNVFGKYLEHRSEVVRRRVVQALVAVAPIGNEQAIAMAIARLKHEEKGVRISALAATAALAGPSPLREAQEHVQSLLEDPDNDVCLAALEAIIAMSGGRTGDLPVSAAIVALLKHKREEVRWHVVNQMSKAAEVQGTDTVRALCACLEDSSSRIRLHVGEALAKITDMEAQAALDEVCLRLEHGSYPVRWAAVKALSRFPLVAGSVLEQRAVATVEALALQGTARVRNVATFTLMRILPQQPDMVVSPPPLTAQLDLASALTSVLEAERGSAPDDELDSPVSPQRSGLKRTGLNIDAPLQKRSKTHTLQTGQVVLV